LRTVSALIGCPISVKLAASFSMLFDTQIKGADRNAQFEHGAGTTTTVVSVDTKKKELIGNLQKWRNRLSSQRQSTARERARLRGQEARQVTMWTIWLNVGEPGFTSITASASGFEKSGLSSYV
jgi:hypothetical protein